MPFSVLVSLTNAGYLSSSANVCAATGLSAHTLIRYIFERETYQLHVYIHMLFLLRVLEHVAGISFPSVPCDVGGSIGGRSGDFTNVGRVARVWVEAKWGQRDDPR